MKALCVLSRDSPPQVPDFHQKKKTLNFTGRYFIHWYIKELFTAAVENIKGANFPVKQLSSVSHL